MPNVIWQPIPGSQTLALCCPYPELIYEGTRGPGKTTFLLADFAREVGKGYGTNWRGMLFRREYGELDDLIAKSYELFPKIFPGAKFLEGEKLRWEFRTGEQLHFRAIKRDADYWKHHGKGYPWIGWDELVNWPTMDLYHQIKSIWRTTTVSGVPLRYRATCNPWGPGHNAVKAYAIDCGPRGVAVTNDQGQKRVTLHGSIYENPYLHPDYLRTLESDPDENRRRAWLYGDWDVTSGGVFDDLWDRRYHVLPRFEIPKSWRIDRSFDAGSAHPFSVGWWAESDGTACKLHDGTVRHFPRGTVFRIAEWYGCTGKPNEGLRMPDSAIADGILEREKAMGIAERVIAGPADSAIFDQHPNVESPASIQAKRGVRWEKADKSSGSRARGVAVLRERLAAAKQVPMEKPGLFIFENCTDWIRTVPVLQRSDKDPDDVNSDMEDHAFDETRYRLTSNRKTLTVGGFGWKS